MTFPRPQVWMLLLLGLVAASCGGPVGRAQDESSPPKPEAKPSADAQALGKVSPQGPALDWPQWRGPYRDGVSRETGLLQQWPAEGPALLWTSKELGYGYSSPSVRGERIYVLGTSGDRSVALCLDLKTGKTIWTTPFGAMYDNDWGGGPRGTPTIDGDRIYALTGIGELACIDAESGKIRWSKNLVADFKGAIPTWGYSESPLIDGDRVLATPGGAQCIVALDKHTGEQVWTSKGFDDAAQYASLIRTTAAGAAQYLTMTNHGLIGVSADDGRLLWRFEKTGNGTAVIPTPVAVGDYVYSTSGYGAGCGLVKLSSQGAIKADEVYANKEIKNQHGGVVLVDGCVYGFSDGGGWVCQNFLTGEAVWREKKLGKGSVVYADGRLYCYTEDEGACALVEASTEGWREHGRFKIPEQSKLERGSGRVWTHPVVSHGRLLLRDLECLFCFDVKAK